MNPPIKRETRLRIGNLAIAGFLSLVPTSITIIVFYLYGLNICQILNNASLLSSSENVKDLCRESVLAFNLRYSIIIWVVITLPTWFWFYSNHSRRIRSTKAK